MTMVMMVMSGRDSTDQMWMGMGALEVGRSYDGTSAPPRCGRGRRGSTRAVAEINHIYIGDVVVPWTHQTCTSSNISSQPLKLSWFTSLWIIYFPLFVALRVLSFQAALAEVLITEAPIAPH